MEFHAEADRSDMELDVGVEFTGNRPKRRHCTIDASNSERRRGTDPVASVSRQIKRLRLPGTEPEPDTGLRLRVRTLSGKTIVVRVPPNGTVASIKQHVEECEGIPRDQQRLVFGGRTLADELPARHYGIADDSLLHLVLALRGGDAI